MLPWKKKTVTGINLTLRNSFRIWSRDHHYNPELKLWFQQWCAISEATPGEQNFLTASICVCIWNNFDQALKYEFLNNNWKLILKKVIVEINTLLSWMIIFLLGEFFSFLPQEVNDVQTKSFINWETFLTRAWHSLGCKTVRVWEEICYTNIKWFEHLKNSLPFQKTVLWAGWWASLLTAIRFCGKFYGTWFMGAIFICYDRFLFPPVHLVIIYCCGVDLSSCL